LEDEAYLPRSEIGPTNPPIPACQFTSLSPIIFRTPSELYSKIGTYLPLQGSSKKMEKYRNAIKAPITFVPSQANKLEYLLSSGLERAHFEQNRST
jgi:hypothetical protein